jgi:hypothetical protein
MANVDLPLAEAGAQRTGIVTLEEGIAASKLAAAVQASLALADTSQQYEVLHCVLDGDGAVVADDAIGTAYTHAGGTIVKAIAVSREGAATFDIDVLFATIAAFPTATLLSASAPIAVAAGQVGEGVLTTWTLIVPPASILVAQQVNGSLVAAKLIDVYVVLSHA